MIDYIKRNHLALLVLGLVLVLTYMGSKSQRVVERTVEGDSPRVGAVEPSTITNPFIFTKNVEVATTTHTSSSATPSLYDLNHVITKYSCANATTTLVANIASPFATSSVITKAIFKQTETATSSVYLFLATTTTAHLGHAPVTKAGTSSSLFNGAPVLASGLSYIVSGTPSWSLYPPNATSSFVTPSLSRMYVAPTDLLALWIEDYGNLAVAGAGTGGWTNQANTGQCELLIEWESY